MIVDKHLKFIYFIKTKIRYLLIAKISLCIPVPESFNTSLKSLFQRLWYTKSNQTQIWYGMKYIIKVYIFIDRMK